MKTSQCAFQKLAASCHPFGLSLRPLAATALLKLLGNMLLVLLGPHSSFSLTRPPSPPRPTLSLLLKEIPLDLHRAPPVSRLVYAWASGAHAGCVPQAAAAAAAAVGGHGGGGGTRTLQTVVAHPSASSTPPPPLPNCCILASATGPFLTLHASVAAAAAAPPSAGLSGERGPPPCIKTLPSGGVWGRAAAASAAVQTLPSGGVWGRAAAASAVVQTLHLDTREHLDAAALLQGGPTGNGSGGGSAGACFRDVPRLWLGLKEGVAAWLLSRCFQEAGLPPPVGLLMLPREVLDTILGLLQVRQQYETAGDTLPSIHSLLQLKCVLHQAC